MAEKIDLGKFDVDLTLFTLVGSPFGGVGALIGFSFDTILARIVAHNLPIEIRHKLAEYLAKASWKLLDVGYWGMLSHQGTHHAARPYALWDARTESMLVSATFGE